MGMVQAEQFVEIDRILRKYNRATWAIHSQNKMLGETLLGAVYSGKLTMPVEIPLNISTLELQISCARSENLKVAIRPYNMELRRLGYSTTDIPSMLLDSALRTDDDETREMVYERFEDEDEEE